MRVKKCTHSKKSKVERESNELINKHYLGHQFTVAVTAPSTDLAHNVQNLKRRNIKN